MPSFAAVRARSAAALSLALTFALTGCGDSITGPRTPEDVTFNPALGIDLDEFTRLPSGVYIRTTAEGSGDPSEPGDRVTVGYALRLPDNTLVATSPPNIAWTLGAGGVIVGFDLGVTGMRVGEERRIIIPSALGYGPGGSGDGRIPGNSVLVFDVTMLTLE